MDGKGAYLVLWNHLLVTDNVDNAVTTFEVRLESIRYNGERKRRNFGKHDRLNTDQHTSLNGLKDYGYSGIDEQSKVRFIMAVIRTDKLEYAKTRILSDAPLRVSLEYCVALYKDFIEHTSSSQNPTLNTSSSRTFRKEIRTVNKRNPNDNNEDEA